MSIVKRYIIFCRKLLKFNNKRKIVGILCTVRLRTGSKSSKYMLNIILNSSEETGEVKFQSFLRN